jgi:hypothetical protein
LFHLSDDLLKFKLAFAERCLQAHRVRLHAKVKLGFL